MVAKVSLEAQFGLLSLRLSYNVAFFVKPLAESLIDRFGEAMIDFFLNIGRWLR